MKPAPDIEGTTLGKYEILERLAIGGMAEIYLARIHGTAGFEKLVVLKRILPRVAEDREFVKMFLDEARLAGTLHHPNIADVFDVGAEDGTHFFAMEYIYGQDARTIWKKTQETGQAIPLPISLAIVCGIAAALTYAHDKTGSDGPLNLVHRDISASNILVSYDGAIKLVDFGIARASMRASQTRTGTLKGKVPYMSPEQCQGAELDRRSDLFSLGIVLYELTVGCRPFRGDNDYMTMEHIVHRVAPKPSTVLPDYPPELETIVMKLLTRDRAQRYQTASAVLEDLEKFVTARGVFFSSLVVAKYMRHMFADQLEAWEAAAQQGTSFSRHIALSRLVPNDDWNDHGTPFTSSSYEVEILRPGARNFARLERAGLVRAELVADDPMTREYPSGRPPTEVSLVINSLTLESAEERLPKPPTTTTTGTPPRPASPTRSPSPSNPPTQTRLLSPPPPPQARPTGVARIHQPTRPPSPSIEKPAERSDRPDPFDVMRTTPVPVVPKPPVLPEPELDERGRDFNEDAPTRQANIKLIRAAFGAKNDVTRSDVVLRFDPIDARSAEILDGLDTGAPVGESADQRISRRMTTLLRRATTWSISGDMESAVTAVLLAFAASKEALALTLIELHRRHITEILEKYLGDRTREIALTRPLRELSTLSLDQHMALLLSQIDQGMTIDELIDVSAMPRLEAYRILCQVFMRGMVRQA